MSCQPTAECVHMCDMDCDICIACGVCSIELDENGLCPEEEEFNEDFRV